MAKIIDFQEAQERRFLIWAMEWIIIPDGVRFGTDYLMAFLVDKKIFTFDEIRAEMRKRHIALNENIYKSAETILKTSAW